MAKGLGRWSLENLIDFECGVAANPQTPDEVRRNVRAAIRGLDGVTARRAGLRLWLDAMCVMPEHGERVVSAMALVGNGLALVAAVAGISAVAGLVNHELHGIHLALFLAVLIGGQWLVLTLAALGWLFRRRAATGCGAIQTLLSSMVRRIAGGRDATWWPEWMKDSKDGRSAILWNLAAMTQKAGVAFNLGILCGLLGLVFTKDLRFYWESTTAPAMASTLEFWVRTLSLPWKFFLPAAVPDPQCIPMARWQPGQALPAAQQSWWWFCQMSVICWGLLPRLILWFAATLAARRVLDHLDFQSRGHRSLWRELTGPDREETDEKPLDGVLVLDVGGTGIRADSLRPFLLQSLRVNPTCWHPVAVMDPGAENQAAQALAEAPAGVTLLAEGWALSPARMNSLLQRIRSQAGPDLPVFLVIANANADLSPAPPTAAEREQWMQYTDSLRDPNTEVFFYSPPQLGE